MARAIKDDDAEDKATDTIQDIAGGRMSSRASQGRGIAAANSVLHSIKNTLNVVLNTRSRFGTSPNLVKPWNRALSSSYAINAATIIIIRNIKITQSFQASLV